MEELEKIAKKYGGTFAKFHTGGGGVLRWDLRNGCLLCANCHWLQSYSAHVDPIGFIDEWFKFAREEDYKYLKAQKDKKINRTIFDYEELEKYLKEKLFQWD